MNASERDVLDYEEWEAEQIELELTGGIAELRSLPREQAGRVREKSARGSGQTALLGLDPDEACPPSKKGAEAMTKTCPVCEKPLPPSRTRPRQFCSGTCRQFAHNAERRAKSLAERAANAMADWQRIERARRG